MAEPKRTPFYEMHVEAGAKIVEFAGFLMPVQYPTGIVEEHKQVRSNVGVFDVSHLGEIEIRGRDALAFVNRLVTNDASKLAMNQVMYTAMCYPEGGIVDDLLVYRFPDRFLLVVNASNADKDYAWIVQNKSGDVVIENQSDLTAELAIQGPKAEPLVQSLVNIPLAEIPYYWFREGHFGGVPAIISRTGYTGEDGFEVYFDGRHGRKAWEALFDKGRAFGLKPIGLGARDSLRLEMGYCLYGNDIDKTTTPLEAGLGWVTKLDKPGFIAKEVLVKQKAEGLGRKLVGFELTGKAFPRQHYKVYAGGSEVGEVTSGMWSPMLEKAVGMAYVKAAHSKTGTPLEVDVRGKRVPGQDVAKPFDKQGSVRKA
jgi:aminomethyltransferase